MNFEFSRLVRVNGCEGLIKGHNIYLGQLVFM